MLALIFTYRYRFPDHPMHIVAIAWIYVIFMMSLTENSLVAGIMTFLLYGVLPLSVILYLMNGKRRRRRRAAGEKDSDSAPRDSS